MAKPTSAKNGSPPQGEISIANSEYPATSITEQLIRRLPSFYINAGVYDMYSRSMEGRGWAAFPKRIILSARGFSYNGEGHSRVLRPNCDHLFRFALFHLHLWIGRVVVFPIEPEPTMNNEPVVAVLSGTDSQGIFRVPENFAFPDSVWFAGVPLS